MLKCGMAFLALSLLGPMEASYDRRSVTHFRTKSVQALLAYLVAEPRSPRSRDFLSEFLWPGMPSGSGRQNLRQTLYEIRQLFPQVAAASGSGSVPLLLTDRQMVQIHPQGRLDLDIDAFERLVEQGTDAALLEIEALYRGDFLEGFFLPDNSEYESWLADKRLYFRRKLLDVLHRLAESSLALGRYDQAESYARKELDLDDFSEAAVRQLMIALTFQGQKAAALGQYEQFKKKMLAELDVLPGPELVELEDKIRENSLTAFPIGARAGLLEEEGVRTPRPVPQNLPLPSTPFVGRQKELEQLLQQLGEDSFPRLITLLGPGGSGKTRLAMEAARVLQASDPDRFHDGIWFISLAKLTEPEAIVSELASVLRFSFPGQDRSPRQQLLDYLCQKRMLLLLDNYEHLLEPGTVPIAADITSAAPDVMVVITSRTRLNIQGEHLVPIAGLSLQDEEKSGPERYQQASEAVRLFWHSARRIRPDFDLTEANLEEINRICALVEGMPLAVELAAAWIELLTPGEIAAEIEQNLDFLETEWQDIPERQRSLRAVFDGSWKALPPAERAAVRRLTLFQGSFSQEAAAAVAGASLKTLLNLSNRSWLVRDEAGRYHLHDLLRRYAGDKLQEDREDWPRTREAFISYYTALMTLLSDEMRGAEQQSAFDTAAREFENIRTTWYWLLDEGSNSEMVERMLPGIFLFCSARSLGDDLLKLVRDAQQPLRSVEGADGHRLAILRTAEIAFSAPGRSVMQLLVARAISWVFEKEEVEKLWQELHEVTDKEVTPLWLIIIATLYGWQVDRDGAIARLRQLMAALQMSRDRWHQAYAMQNLARLLTQTVSIVEAKQPGPEKPYDSGETSRLHDNPEWIEGQRLFNNAEAIFTEVGDQLEKANTLQLAGLLKIGFDLEGAKNDLLEAMKLMRKQGDLASAANILSNLAEVAIMQGDTAQVFAYFDETIAIFERLGSRQLIASTLSIKSINLLRFGDIDDARTARIRSLELFREVEDDDMTAWSLWELGEIERVAGAYDLARKQFEEAELIFRRFNNPLGHVFYFRGLGDIYLAQGDAAAALECFERSLEIALSRHDWSAVYALGGLGRAQLSLGDYQAAAADFRRGLKLADDINHIDLTMGILAGICRLLLETGQEIEALELATFVNHHHMTWVEIRKQVQDIIQLASTKLTTIERTTAQERGRAAAREAVVAGYLNRLNVDSDQWIMDSDQQIAGSGKQVAEGSKPETESG